MSAELSGIHKTATKMSQNLATLSFGDIIRFKIVVSVCLYRIDVVQYLRLDILQCSWHVFYSVLD